MPQGLSGSAIPIHVAAIFFGLKEWDEGWSSDLMWPHVSEISKEASGEGVLPMQRWAEMVLEPYGVDGHSLHRGPLNEASPPFRDGDQDGAGAGISGGFM